MTVNIIGLGYIGLPTALMLASKGANVTGTDYNGSLISSLKLGEANFDEIGLHAIFDQARATSIVFTTEYVNADIYIIAVPTPYLKDSKKIDPSYVVEAVKNILVVCEKGAIIIIESTISPGTVDKFIRPTIENYGFRAGEDIHIAHAPERIIPGNIIYELENNSRTIGVDDNRIGKVIETLYKSFCHGEIVLTDIRTAEMTKVVENTYRDINIAFANELTKICKVADLNVYEIIRIANMHPRVNILQPGPGVGGHCISVDPWFLVGDYPGLANIILAARKINDSMPEYVLERIGEIMDEHKMSDISRVGLYGLTYKEDVDDVRESPTLQLLEIMRKHLATGLKVYDPMVKKNIVANQYQDFKAFIQDIDLVVIMVAHTQIKNKSTILEGKLVLDTKNIYKEDNTYKL